MANAILPFYSMYPQHGYEASIIDTKSVSIGECPSVSCAIASGGKIFVRQYTLEEES